METRKLYKELRKLEGISITEVSHKSHISRRTIERFERGETDLGYRKLESLCLSIGYILTIKKEKR
jgi:transcriptional regulator with XRE-family HTH domain